MSALTNVASTFAGNGTLGFSDNPIGTRAMLGAPFGVAVDGAGRVFFTDSSSDTLRVVAACAWASASQTPTPTLSPGASASSTPAPTPSLTPSSTAGGCTVTTVLGSVTGVAGNIDGVANAARFFNPFGLAFSPDGTVLWVTDENNHRLRRVDVATSTVTTFAGSVAGFANGDGTGALFNEPAGVVVDAFGAVFLTDRKNHRLRLVLANGTVLTFAGQGSAGCVFGPASTARFNDPFGLAFVSASALAVVSTNCHSINLIDVFPGALGDNVSLAGNVSLVAGTGVSGYSDGPASSAQFNQPRGVAADPATGFLYVTEDAGGRVRSVSPEGWVSTLAGHSGGLSPLDFADGTGTSAFFDNLNLLQLWPGGGALLVAGAWGRVCCPTSFRQ